MRTSKSVRVRCVVADNFEWVFRAFRSPEIVSKISPKVLRALLARSYELVRHDIPRKTIEANFQMLESAVQNASEMAKLLGLTTISDPSFPSAKYPYCATDIAQRLGWETWHPVDRIIKKIHKEKNFNIKASDNRYHYTVKFGVSFYHKYSEEALSLFKKIQKGEDYDI